MNASKRMRVEVQPNGCGFIMRGDEVLADFEDPALARALLDVVRIVRRDGLVMKDWCDCREHRAIRRALARLDKVSR